MHLICPLISFLTAPCPPTNLTARADCGTNLGTLKWTPSVHAISYTATMSGTHGHVVSCSSNTTTCSAKLDCGHQYSAVVIASSATCNSSTGASLTFDSGTTSDSACRGAFNVPFCFEAQNSWMNGSIVHLTLLFLPTAPCLPDRVVADLDCNVNSFVVQWRGSIGDLDSYMAIAIGSDGTHATCDTTNTSCVIPRLKCGLSYNIVVTTSSVDCGTIEGSDYSMHSGSKSYTFFLKCSKLARGHGVSVECKQGCSS